MIKFQIIIEKKGVNPSPLAKGDRAKKTIKPFLGKTMSSLALVLSVLVLSAIIGLGIHLVFAGPYSNPTANPPLENVEGPVNVSDVPQTKEGDIYVDQAFQKNKTWRFRNSGNAYVANVAAGASVLAPNIVGSELIYALKDLSVDDKIYAPNQDWENLVSAVRTVTNNPDGAYLTCPDGWFLRKVWVRQGGKQSQGWCAAPFKKYDDPVGGGGDELKEAMEAGYWGVEDYLEGANWWFLGGN